MRATTIDPGPAGDEWRAVLDEEVQRLPWVYRAPVLLCYLEGLSHAEAARQLGWPVGTLKGRLARARQQLGQRLSRRGVDLSATALAAAVPTGLVTSTVKNALAFVAGAVPGSAAALAEAALGEVVAAKFKLGAALVLLVGVLIGGVTLAALPTGMARLPADGEKDQSKQEKPRPRADRHGDPLPEGAVARLGTVRWRTGREVQALAFSPDGKTVASSAGGIRLFDLDGKLTTQIGSPHTSFNCLAFSPDGRRLVCSWVGGMLGRIAVQIWEVSTGRKTQEFQAEDVAWLGWSAEGEPLAVLLVEPGAARLCELSSGKERRFEASDLTARALYEGYRDRCAYSPVAKVLAASGLHGGIVHVWDVSTGKKRWAIETKRWYVDSLALSADGKTLATLTREVTDDKQTVQFWDVATGKAKHTLIADQLRSLYAVAFSPDGKTLATVGADEVRFWDVPTGRQRSRTRERMSVAQAVAFSPDGQTLATVGKESVIIRLWDVATGALKSAPEGHTDRVMRIEFSPDGRRVATGSMDGTAFIWDLNSAEPLSRIRHGDWARGCAFSADGRTLFGG